MHKNEPMHVDGHVYVACRIFRGGKYSIYPLKGFLFRWVIIAKVALKRIPSEAKARRDKKNEMISVAAVTLCCYVQDGKVEVQCFQH